MTDDEGQHRGEPADRFAWERALRDDPAVVGTQLLVLLTLGTFMSSDGQDARPSQDTLALKTGLSARCVREHLSAAVTGGWLVRTRRGHRRGDGTAVASEYRATIPQPELADRLTSTGTGTPVEHLNRNGNAPQPERRAVSTGTPVPTTKSFDHVKKTKRPVARRAQLLQARNWGNARSAAIDTPSELMELMPSDIHGDSELRAAALEAWTAARVEGAA